MLLGKKGESDFRMFTKWVTVHRVQGAVVRGRTVTKTERRITMLVKNWMSKGAVTINVNNSMVEATKKLKEHNISMLPVSLWSEGDFPG